MYIKSIVIRFTEHVLDYNIILKKRIIFILAYIIIRGGWVEMF